ARRTLMEAYNAQLDSLERRSHLKELEVFFTAVASVYDPHTAYLPPQRKEELDVQLSGTTEGIGVLLEARGHQRVIAGLIPGSTGWQLGTLAVGDVVVMVAEAKRDPVALVDMPLDEATALLQGPRGSTIVLTVQKPNGRTITVQVRRDTVVLIETFARGALLTFPKKDQRHPTGYIHLPRMYGDPREGGAEPGGRRSSDDVGVLLDALKQRGIQHLILDLRNNGGGFLDDARRIAGFFIDQGPVAQLQHADGTLNILQDETPGMRYSGHVVLLVNGETHSSAEVLAAALQDHDRALVVGSPQTYGKGTAQIIVDLDAYIQAPGLEALRPLGFVKLSNQRIYRIQGASLQRRGVRPALLLPDPDAAAPHGERHLDGSLPWMEIAPLSIDHQAALPGSLDALRAASLRRQQHTPALRRLAQQASHQHRTPPTSVPLDLNAMRTHNTRRRSAPSKPHPEEASPRLQVAPLQTHPNPDPGRDHWNTEVAHDPWIHECLHILNDMAH
ncbi:MAG: carboxy terminal-processing peptidase, partial [Myxococcota bacterium]